MDSKSFRKANIIALSGPRRHEIAQLSSSGKLSTLVTFANPNAEQYSTAKRRQYADTFSRSSA